MGNRRVVLSGARAGFVHGGSGLLRGGGWLEEVMRPRPENRGERMPLPPGLVALIETVRRVGRPFLVGGCVRDWLLGLTPHDFDIEVFGTSFDRLRDTLARFGPTDVVGKSFGVVKVRLEEAEYDFALPRRERKTAGGHRGFEVDPNPDLTLAEAAARRDFTINAIAYDPVDHRLVDPHGGAIDLESGILRHVGPAFVEDPLRVLRGFQFAARFDMKMDPETAALCRSILETFEELPRQRIWGEWEKWTALAVRPSAGLKVLEETGWIAKFPAVDAMRGVPQEPEWHPEGDVFNHTLHCVDALAALPEWRESPRERRRFLMLAVLAHDFGKAVSTERATKGGRLRWISPGHDKSGVAIADKFLDQIGSPRNVIDVVLPLVEEHMYPLQPREPPLLATIRRLARRLEPATIEDLAIVVTADSAGRPPLPAVRPREVDWLLDAARRMRLDRAAPKPILLGRHLIEAGLQPGPHFKPILDDMFEAQLEGAFANEEEGGRYLKQYLERARAGGKG